MKTAATNSTSYSATDEFGYPIEVKPARKKKRTEGILQKTICARLELAGYFVIRINSGAFTLGGRPFFAYTITNNNSHAGFPDLLAFRGSQTLLIEVKAPNGRTSDKQRATHKLLAKYGVSVHVIKAVEELEPIIAAR